MPEMTNSSLLFLNPSFETIGYCNLKQSKWGGGKETHHQRKEKQNTGAIRKK